MHTHLDLAAVLGTLVDLQGAGLRVLPAASHQVAPESVERGVLTLGVDAAGALPDITGDAFDMLLTTAAAAPAPWISVAADALEDSVAELKRAIEQQPVAAAVIAQVLRLTLKVSFEEALLLESLAYSTLLASGPFRSWRERTPIRRSSADGGPRVELTRAGNTLNLRLNRPSARNAVDARMRDSLVEALEAAVVDVDTHIVITGAGPTFCAGGDLNEFGRTEDVGVAHLIRVLRSPVRLVHRLRERVHVRVHGASIGAGIEISAAAADIAASADAFFRLPELSMGLIPGAGGTVSIPRRIGRHRTCYMATSGRDIDARTAAAWGLIDAIEESERSPS